MHIVLGFILLGLGVFLMGFGLVEAFAEGMSDAPASTNTGCWTMALAVVFLVVAICMLYPYFHLAVRTAS